MSAGALFSLKLTHPCGFGRGRSLALGWARLFRAFGAGLWWGVSIRGFRLHSRRGRDGRGVFKRPDGPKENVLSYRPAKTNDEREERWVRVLTFGFRLKTDLEETSQARKSTQHSARLILNLSPAWAVPIRNWFALRNVLTWVDFGHFRIWSAHVLWKLNSQKRC